MADRAAEPAILFKIARRMRHHPENVGVAVLAQDFAGAVVCLGRIAVSIRAMINLKLFRFVAGGRFERHGFIETIYPADGAGQPRAALPSAARSKPVWFGGRLLHAASQNLDAGEPKNAAALPNHFGTVDIR